MTNFTAILNHLQASSLLEVREWAKVLWVKAIVAGRVICRFVSKKIGVTEMKKEFNFINKEMSGAVLDQTCHKVFVMIEGQKYVCKYFSNEGQNRAWNKLKNEVKAQSRWDADKKIWVAVCGYEEFCTDWRLTCCQIRKIK